MTALLMLGAVTTCICVSAEETPQPSDTGPDSAYTFQEHPFRDCKAERSRPGSLTATALRLSFIDELQRSAEQL